MLKQSLKKAYRRIPGLPSIRRAVYEKQRRSAERREFLNPIKKQMKAKPNALLWVLTPIHGNMGDHAIAQAEALMFRQLCIETIEVDGTSLAKLQKLGALGCMNGRGILVHGGGFIGTLWPSSERLLRDLVRQNPDSPILCLPNTFYFDDTEMGRQMLLQSMEIYNAHPDMKLYARERISYEQMKPCFRSLSLTPDMVMMMNRTQPERDRHGLLLCLRSDREKTMDQTQEEQVRSFAESCFGSDVTRSDMCVEGTIPISRRDEALEEKYELFRKASLVITDRLHGMIFAAITGTPCIVLNSKSHKLQGCYEWLRSLPYIVFARPGEDLNAVFQRMPKGSFNYDNTALLPLFDPLKEDILRMAASVQQNK